MDTMRLDGEKLSLHPVLVTKWIEGNLRGPIYVEISPTNRCNHKCIFCACKSIQDNPVNIRLGVMKDLISSLELSGTRSIMFAGEGEPLLHPDIEEILDYTASMGVDFSITTNGSKLNSLNMAIILKAKWIKISIDAGCAETYAITHGVKVAEWNKLFDAIYALHAMKKISGSHCVIGIQITTIQENHDEISALATKLKQVGGDYLVVKPYSKSLFTVNCMSDKNFSTKTIQRTVRKCNSFFPVYYRKAAFDAIEKGYSYGRCHAVPYLWAYIRSNGDVIGCSSHMLKEEFVYGNINDALFHKIWDGDKRKIAIKYMAGYDISNCRKACRMNQCNQYLHDVLYPGEHYNFI